MFYLFIYLFFTCFQNHEFTSETKLPSGLRGRHQQAGQPGAVRFLRLLVHGKSLNIWTEMFDEAIKSRMTNFWMENPHATQLLVIQEDVVGQMGKYLPLSVHQ